ncbi:lysylphosphatidylglycerol synthase transmembrane domain-containing protein [Mesobacillus thioparans]|uniref:lysylphosphatidylglycerol synthase transmembrane domain-containing protein n=1 Tax=Mesobacillus thioparans TaxID=370439 RepID=UPI0039EE41BD
MARNKSFLLKIVAVILMIIFAILSFRYFHIDTLVDESIHFWKSASLFWGAVFAYLLAFLIRALAWKMYIPQHVKYTNCVQGVFLSLFINHIAPIKAGDLFRAGFLAAKEKELTLDESVNSVIFMRILDVFTLASIAGAGMLLLGKELVFSLSLPLLASFAILVMIILLLLNRYLPDFFQKHLLMLKNALAKKTSLYLLPLVLISWVLESFVIWNVAKSMGISLAFLESMWVNSITVGGQVFQITPGGISTYESVMTAALALLGIGTREAYTASILSHGFKFIFSYFTGLLLLVTSPAYIRRELRSLGTGRKKG